MTEKLTNLWKNCIWVLSLRFLYPLTVLSELIVMIYFKKGSIETPCTIFLWPSKVCIFANLPWDAFHKMAVPSTEHETKQLESLAQQMSMMSPTWPLSWRGWPHYTVSSYLPNSAGSNFRDHTTTIWSSDPVARNYPLGENLTTFTVEVCPLCKSYRYSGVHLTDPSCYRSCTSSQNYKKKWVSEWDNECYGYFVKLIIMNEICILPWYLYPLRKWHLR